MKPLWIVEDYSQEPAVGYLVDEIKSQGFPVDVWSVKSFMDMHKEIEKENQKYPGEQCIIFTGSIGMVQNIQHFAKWVPGTWSNFKELSCTNYYSFLGKYCLNEDHAFLTIKEFERRISWCFDTFGIEDVIFVRPNSNAKSFSGQQLPREKLGTDLQWIIDPTFSNPTDLVLISSPKNIEKEYRFVAADQDVIAGSLYKTEGQMTVHPNYDENAFKLAQEIVKIPYTSDRMKVLDICKTQDGEYKLLEVGGFSCAGLYACDMAVIVKRASEIAVEEFIDITTT